MPGCLLAPFWEHDSVPNHVWWQHSQHNHWTCQHHQPKQCHQHPSPAHPAQWCSPWTVIPRCSWSCPEIVDRIADRMLISMTRKPCYNSIFVSPWNTCDLDLGIASRPRWTSIFCTSSLIGFPLVCYWLCFSNSQYNTTYLIVLWLLVSFNFLRNCVQCCVLCSVASVECLLLEANSKLIGQLWVQPLISLPQL